MNQDTYNLVAVDISKDSLEVYIPNDPFSTPNTKAGIKKLIKVSRKLGKPFVIFEATGGFERLLMESLHQAGIDYCLVPPSRVRAFASSEGIKAKTDLIDARVIYRFAQEKRLKPTLPLPKEIIKLRSLVDRRAQLIDLQAQEKTHLHMVPEITRPLVLKMIDVIEAQVQEIELLIRQLIRSYQTLKSADKKMRSVVGVGEVNSWTLLAYLHEIFHLKRNALVALVGIAPYNRDSGNMKKRRCIMGGRAKVRKNLYMAAKTAAQHNPVIKPYVNGLLERGKPYKCAMVAAMRKLLIHLQSILQNSEIQLA